MSYLRKVIENKSLTYSKFYDSSLATLGVADIFPILLQFSGEVVKDQLIVKLPWFNCELLID